MKIISKNQLILEVCKNYNEGKINYRQLHQNLRSIIPNFQSVQPIEFTAFKILFHNGKRPIIINVE